MAKRRRFTPQFKAEVVIGALRGQGSQTDAITMISPKQRLRLKVLLKNECLAGRVLLQDVMMMPYQLSLGL